MQTRNVTADYLSAFSARKSIINDRSSDCASIGVTRFKLIKSDSIAGVFDCRVENKSVPAFTKHRVGMKPCTHCVDYARRRVTKVKKKNVIYAKAIKFVENIYEFCCCFFFVCLYVRS